MRLPLEGEEEETSTKVSVDFPLKHGLDLLLFFFFFSVFLSSTKTVRKDEKNK